MSIFSSVRLKKPKRTAFNLSHEVKMSMPMGKLVPFLCQDVVPGDTFNMNTELMMRLAPMISPVMHRVNVYTHFFFVPNRIIWNEWEDFITGGEKGDAAPVSPYMTKNNYYLLERMMHRGSLADYLGFPSTDKSHGGVDPTVPLLPDDFPISSLPFRAYQMIYNEYYRDQNLEEPIAISKESGLELAPVELLQLRDRCWEKDYFTSALPWTQRGGEVHLPIAGDAEVRYNASIGDPDTNAQVWKKAGDGNVGADTGGVDLRPNSVHHPGASMYDSNNDPVNLDPNGTLFADMSNVSSTTINELRLATRLQRWLERTARGGSRYIEQIASHFGVRSSDARLQRPEFLGGGKSPVVISEVLQTSSTDNNSPQANMAGHGISVGNTHRFKRYFEEHGFVIGIISVLPRTSYQQGLPRQFQRRDKFDYYWPEFAHLGEQPVYENELYMSATDNVHNPRVFGYQSRYSEYKFIASRVAGDFKGNLNFWHMGRIFDNRPLLNKNFVQSDPTKRIFAVTDPDEHPLYVQIYNNIKAIRPMPRFGTPML